MSVDLAIAARADRQHGNITRAQLLRLNLSDDQIAYRLKLGRLHRVHWGVYAVGRPPKTALERAAAAVLACGPGAVLSHLSALAHWGFIKHWPTVFDVTVTGNRRPSGIRVHRCPGLQRIDTRTHVEIRTTSPARTLLDCAPLLDDKARARAVNEARLSKHLKLPALADVVKRYPHHPGAKLLKPFIETTDGPTRADWEREFPKFCARYGLPKPVMGAKVGHHTVDALFEEEKLIIELDSWEFHQDRQAFETDRERDADTLAAGYVTVRITWERIIHRPDPEAARLHTILRRLRANAA